MMQKYLEYRDDESLRFWEITVTDKSMVIRWGKLGSEGQFKEQLCKTNKVALIEAEKLSTEKILKGYVSPEDQLFCALNKNVPNEFKKLRLIWDKLNQKLERLFGKDDWHRGSKSFETLTGLMFCSKWGWTPRGKTVNFLETARFGQHAFGYMYTSNEYPWPCFNNVPYTPIIQLDLDVISDCIGVNIGSGFLQLFDCLFCSSYDRAPHYFRHIPRNKISQELLTEFPTYTPEEKKVISKHIIYPNFENTFSETSAAIQIDGFGSKFFALPAIFDFDRIIEEVDTLKNDIEDLDEKFYKKIKSYFNNFDKALAQVRNYADSHSGNYSFNASFFGLYKPIQTYFNESDITLFNFGGYRPFILGWENDGRTDMNGSASIFMRFNKKTCKWDFDFDIEH
jgi:predicted DNA-binding WGR domain protein